MIWSCASFGTILVLAGEVQHQRAADLVLLVQMSLDADAVIADRAIHAGARRRQIGELAAQAVAERADLAGAFRPAAQRLHAGRDVLDAGIDVELLEELERLLPLLRRIGHVDHRLHAPEQIRRQHDIAFLGIELGDLAHIGVDAEDLLAQHDAGTAAARRHRHISLEPAAVRGRDIDPLSAMVSARCPASPYLATAAGLRRSDVVHAGRSHVKSRSAGRLRGLRLDKRALEPRFGRSSAATRMAGESATRGQTTKILTREESP